MGVDFEQYLHSTGCLLTTDHQLFFVDVKLETSSEKMRVFLSVVVSFDHKYRLHTQVVGTLSYCLFLYTAVLTVDDPERMAATSLTAHPPTG